ncbi:immunity 49 family protein [Streptomyces roseifaciens]|uniref:immunity 49 family protein n=1 Tax=Streptomyces roseifaciens TaxID=1488406 RepID=UPI000717F605|nr:immunity 49 family protein [Streptomyces roseifaciens]
MHEVTQHQVSEQRIAEALDDIRGRARGRWYRMSYDDPSPEALCEMRDDLLDHVAARAVKDPALDESSRMALRTAAECSLGALSLGCFPNGDQEIVFPLIGEELNSENIAFKDFVKQAPTAGTWIETFEICLVSGLVWDWQRVIGLLLREDFAPAIHQGVPYSDLTSTSGPADLAAMDALCLYLAQADGHLPRDWPTVVLRMPTADERAEAARQLDALDALTADQHLLRVLLDDDQQAFEQALVARLTEHRDSTGSDPSPRTLLPLGALALAALAVQVHGWELGVRSGYLPHSLLGSPEALRRAAATQVNTLGGWVAKG